VGAKSADLLLRQPTKFKLIIGVETRIGPSTPQRYAGAARPTTPSPFSSDFIFDHFTSSRTCATMLTRAVSEGDAARPITASHLRARMQGLQAYRPRWRGRLWAHDV